MSKASTSSTPSSGSKSAAKPEAKAEAKPVDHLEAFHGLARQSNSFANMLGQWQPNGEKSIGISEWTVLKLFGDEAQLPSRRIVKALGVTRQRMKQLSDRLQEQGHVTSARSDGGKGKGSTYTITPAGRKVVQEFDDALKSRLQSSEINARSLAKMAGALRRLSKAMNPPAPASGEAAKKAPKAGKAA